MDRNGYKQCMPHNVDPDVTELPSLDFSSGYVQRSIAKLPKQGSKRPWRLYPVSYTHLTLPTNREV